jgi:hypothetical protein
VCRFFAQFIGVALETRSLDIFNEFAMCIIGQFTFPSIGIREHGPTSVPRLRNYSRFPRSRNRPILVVRRRWRRLSVVDETPDVGQVWHLGGCWKRDAAANGNDGGAGLNLQSRQHEGPPMSQYITHVVAVDCGTPQRFTSFVLTTIIVNLLHRGSTCLINLSTVTGYGCT